jgi:hypothetical protein
MNAKIKMVNKFIFRTLFLCLFLSLSNPREREDTIHLSYILRNILKLI